jgi:CDP-diacylglycerol--serine O-phosphatidyltransferase
MVFDALDGKVARMTGGASAFGTQLDSLSDALTFGCVPALLAKILIEHEGPLRGYHAAPRLHFIAAAVFASMAILRLARFNLETRPEDEHASFRGLPSPAAAGAVASMVLFYIAMSRPELELDDRTLTPLGRALTFFPEVRLYVPWWYLPSLALTLPLLGFLMVSRVPYVHLLSLLSRRGSFFVLVGLVLVAFLLFAAPVPALFLGFNGFVLHGLIRRLLGGRAVEREEQWAGSPSGDPSGRFLD